MWRDWLIGYAEDVLQGEIIACKKHKWACQRFLHDIDREGSEDFPFLFDEKKAERFMFWMTRFKHRKGVLSGQNIVPHPIQAFIFCNIYGWVHKKTGYRRFRKAYWQVARKNAKSQSLALVGLYEIVALGEQASECYCGATKTEQAKVVWEEASWLIDNCPDLKDKYKVAYGRIQHLKSGSMMRPLSKEDRKSGDGLNPQCAIIDEYHAHETSEIYDIMVSGMGARQQPLIIIITTAGFELNRPCYSVEYNYVSQILDPEKPVDNEEYFVMINELDQEDDIKDEQAWEKANPIICSYDEGKKYLRGELMVALEVPEKMRNYLTKNMNRWVDQKDNGYMIMERWNACGVSRLPDLTGMEAIVGVDLSAKIDLTSVGFEFVLDDGTYVVTSHSFMPEDTLPIKRRTDKMPYDLWVKQGWITLTPGAVVDYRFIQAYIIEQAKKNDWSIREICFDPYNSTQFAAELMADGYECVEIRQGVKTLSEPTKSFRELVYSGRVIHGDNPVLTWAVGNAVVRQDHNENIMLDKDKSTNRIDPIAAIINAHVRAITLAEGPSVYSSRGLISL